METIEELMKEYKEKIGLNISQKNEDEIICIHNQYCYLTQCYNGCIKRYEDLNDLCYGLTPIEIIEKYGNISFCDYFRYNEFGFAIEASQYDVDINTIAEYCVNEDFDLYDFHIRDLLDELNEKIAELKED